jgi:alpha-ketoglutarate-dependent taurine dioxygenase
MATKTQQLDVEVRRLDAPVGAEVFGLDLRKPIPARFIPELDAALYENVLLLFRGQSLTEAEQLAFCRQFGELYLTLDRKVPNGVVMTPDSRLVSNLEEHRSTVSQLHDSEMSFHHDTIFKDEPQKALCMHAIEIPTYGGNTLFANMYLAYEALPADLKARIAGKTALHVFAYTQTQRPDISKGYDRYEHAHHPLAIRHPATGRAALYVDRLMTMRIDGMPERESDELLAALFAHAERPEFHYEHVWRKGDVVLWDNLASMHARTDIPKDQRRLLRHSSVKGLGVPAAAA